MLAYYDSLMGGLVPCRIVAVGDWSDPLSQCRVQYTATRKGFTRGQFDTLALRDVVPRSAVYRSGRRWGQYRIGDYSWPQIVTAGEAR